MNEEQLRRAILILWRTNLLRQTRLKVIDEVANGLSYYDYTFFRELPRLYGAIEDKLERARRSPARADPLVPAHRLVDRRRPRRQSLRHRGRAQRGDAAAERAGARPTISTNCMNSAPNCRSPPIWCPSARSCTRLPTAPPIPPLARREEPYRRAITGMYSRLARTARDLDHVVALRQPIVDLPAYAKRRRILAPISTRSRARSRRTARRSSPADGCGRSARGRRVRLPSARRSISGRTPTCTSAPWPRFSPPPRPASTTGP